MKYKIILLLFVTSIIHANVNYVEAYRTGGLKEVEKLINLEMTKETYWKQYLNDKNVSNGFYEKQKYIIVTNKKTKKLDIYDNTNMNNVHVFNSTVITGEANGSKELEGDLKTPVGAYSFTKRLTKLDSFYGPMALVTNYPNNLDKIKGKTGSGIWIHGMPFNDKREPFTKGCIALDNNQLINLDKNIDLKKSILLITKDKKIDTSADDISFILSQIYLWKDSWTHSDLNKYLSFYSSDFKKLNGMNFERFSIYKKRIFAKNEKKSIVFKNISIIPYPSDDDKNIFKITLYQEYKATTFKFFGNKELFVEIIDNRMKILTEN